MKRPTTALLSLLALLAMGLMAANPSRAEAGSLGHLAFAIQVERTADGDPIVCPLSCYPFDDTEAVTDCGGVDCGDAEMALNAPETDESAVDDVATDESEAFDYERYYDDYGYEYGDEYTPYTDETAEQETAAGQDDTKIELNSADASAADEQLDEYYGEYAYEYDYTEYGYDYEVVENEVDSNVAEPLTDCNDQVCHPVDVLEEVATRPSARSQMSDADLIVEEVGAVADASDSEIVDPYDAYGNQAGQDYDGEYEYDYDYEYDEYGYDEYEYDYEYDYQYENDDYQTDAASEETADQTNAATDETNADDEVIVTSEAVIEEDPYYGYEHDEYYADDYYDDYYHLYRTQGDSSDSSEDQSAEDAKYSSGDEYDGDEAYEEDYERYYSEEYYDQLDDAPAATDEATAHNESIYEEWEYDCGDYHAPCGDACDTVENSYIDGNCIVEANDEIVDDLPWADEADVADLDVPTTGEASEYGSDYAEDFFEGQNQSLEEQLAPLDDADDNEAATYDLPCEAAICDEHLPIAAARTVRSKFDVSGLAAKCGVQIAAWTSTFTKLGDAVRTACSDIDFDTKHR